MVDAPPNSANVIRTLSLGIVFLISGIVLLFTKDPGPMLVFMGSGLSIIGIILLASSVWFLRGGGTRKKPPF
jgi:hypothetical protein